jgi:hypothetical protein
LPADFVAINLGHHDIKEDEVGVRLGSCDLERFHSVGGDLVPVLFSQKGTKKGYIIRCIVDDKNRSFFCSLFHMDLCPPPSSTRVRHRKFFTQKLLWPALFRHATGRKPRLPVLPYNRCHLPVWQRVSGEKPGLTQEEDASALILPLRAMAD